MVSPCVVHLCRNIGKHRFPKNEVRRAQWVEAIKHIKPGLSIRKNSLICSAHFRPTDFSITPTSFTKLDCAPKILKNTAIPSVFPWTNSSQEQPSTSQDPFIFDPTDVHTTYSRTPPIAFAEEQPFLETITSDDIEDPLQCEHNEETKDPLQCSDQGTEESLQHRALHHQETDSHLDCNPDDYNIVEIEIGISNDNTEELALDDSPLHVTKQHDKSVQTQDKGMHSSRIQHDKTAQTPGMFGFGIYYFKNNTKSLHFYTGLENFNKIMLVFYSLGKSVYNLNYFYGKPPQKIDPLEQFFITLVILRRHKTFEEISMLYDITLKHVYSIIITWIRFMSLQWKNLDLWVEKENVKAYFPFDFHDKYPATRTVLDCTECPVKKPKLPLAQQITFSSYKNRNTIKFLIGITPGGLISYVSPSYGGSATDRQIIERSTILDRFNYNDEIMVDKGLNVQDIFVPYGVKVNMPAFFKKGNQIASDTLTSNRKVASKRVHIERVIGMLKTYRILTEPMNQTETLLSSDIVFICAMLVNFRTNIINKNA